MKGETHGATSICRFCEKELLEQERTHRHGLCHECFHLRRMIWREGWQNKRVGVKSSVATERVILSWLCSGQVSHRS
jgi:hypothetical protein